MRTNCDFRGDIIEQSSSCHRLRPAVMLFLFFFMILCSLLVCMRIYSLRLDRHSAILQSRIVEMKRESAAFEKDIIALSAPSVIYEYASKRLGMTEGMYVGVIKVKENIGDNVANFSKHKRWTGAMLIPSEKKIRVK